MSIQRSIKLRSANKLAREYDITFRNGREFPRTQWTETSHSKTPFHRKFMHIAF